LVAGVDLTGESTFEAIQAVLRAYRSMELEALVYKAVPAIFHRRVNGDDVHALFRLGARWSRSDLASFIDVARRSRPTRRRSRSIRKALRVGIELSSGHGEFGAFWPVVTSALRERYRTVPTHSLAEIKHLAAMFPDDIECVVARHRGSVVAGAVVYTTPTCLHTQYLAASPEGRIVSALDLIIEAIIAKASACEKRYVSFGISTEQGGWVLNRGLHEYKTSFGASTITFDCYTLSIL
jgi:Acetyltransferase (GNAT) domain